jgi:hypothetical protein
MMIYDMTLQHQAERALSVAEQRRVDEQLGRMAARVSRAWRRPTRRPGSRTALWLRQVTQSAGGRVN